MSLCFKSKEIKKLVAFVFKAMEFTSNAALYKRLAYMYKNENTDQIYIYWWKSQQ